MDVRNLFKITDMYAKVDWKDYFGEGAVPKVKEYIENNKSTIFPWLYDTIKFSLEQDLKEVAILRFSDTKIFATLQSKDYAEFLGVLEKYFVSVEEYETCAEIRDLIIDLKVKELIASKPKRRRKSKQSEPELVKIQK